MRQLFAAVCLLLSLLTAGTAAAQVPLPELRARVTDLTATLDEAQRGQLEQAAQRIEQAHGAQVAMLLLPTTAPEPIEAFAIRLAEAWKIGRKGMDDGVIVIVAKDDRTARIEVGYGLEGAIPDVVAKRLIAEVMTPRFRAGDFYGGLAATLDALGGLIAGERLPPPSTARASEFDLGGNAWPMALMFVFVVGGILRAVLGRFLGACVGGGLAFFGAWLVLGSLLAGAVVALIAFFITLAGGGRFGSGIGGGFGGGSGGLGGGGFSGGGGGFGGGGASGRW
jgi:uncharacterized protein